MATWQYARLVQVREHRTVHDFDVDPESWGLAETSEAQATAVLAGDEPCLGINRTEGAFTSESTLTVTTELHELCCSWCRADPRSRVLPSVDVQPAGEARQWQVDVGQSEIPGLSGLHTRQRPGQRVPVPPEPPKPVKGLLGIAKVDPSEEARYQADLQRWQADVARVEARYRRRELEKRLVEIAEREASAHENCCAWPPEPPQTSRRGGRGQREVVVRRQVFEDTSTTKWTVMTYLVGADGSREDLESVVGQEPETDPAVRMPIGDKFVARADGDTVGERATVVAQRGLNRLGADGWELVSEELRQGVFRSASSASSDWVQRTFWLRRSPG